MTSNYKKYGFLTLVLALSVSVSGCSRKLYEEGNITTNRVQVEQTKFSETVKSSEFDNGYARALGMHYDATGEGGVNVSVLYDPKSRANTAMHASQHVSRVASLMRDNGIHDLEANILPIQNLGDEAEIMVTFMSYEAHAPKDCETMPGFKDTDIGYREDYAIGCTVETVIARQIARPKDLAGQGSSGVTDGRRAGNVVDRYRTGVPNESLDGESASGDN